MNLRDYPEKDGMMVWLDKQEIRLFLEQAEHTKQRIAFLLGLRSGLRSDEIVNVAPADVVDSSAGPRVRVWDAKGGKSRETPAPRELVNVAATLADMRDEPDDEPMVDVSTRTIQRWTKKAAAKCREITDDDGWQFMTPHDMRRTWATQIAGAEVDSYLVLEWGGWEDLETFRSHYKGAFTPNVQRRELSKVPWMNLKETETERVKT